MRSPSSDQALAVHSPLSSSSLVAPAVSSVDMKSTKRMMPATSTTSSSIATRPSPLPLMGAHGMTCFCPLSAMAIHQRPGFDIARKARSLCFSPLLALSYFHSPSTSHIQWE